MKTLDCHARHAAMFMPVKNVSDTVWLPLLAERFFAANVKMEREARGMTQAELARVMTGRGVPLSQSAIAKLEREDDETRRPISLTEAAALAALFDNRSLNEMTTTPAEQASRAVVEAKTRQQATLYNVMAAEAALDAARAAAREAQQQYDAALAKAHEKG